MPASVTPLGQILSPASGVHPSGRPTLAAKWAHVPYDALCLFLLSADNVWIMNILIYACVSCVCHLLLCTVKTIICLVFRPMIVVFGWEGGVIGFIDNRRQKKMFHLFLNRPWASGLAPFNASTWLEIVLLVFQSNAIAIPRPLTWWLYDYKPNPGTLIALTEWSSIYMALKMSIGVLVRDCAVWMHQYWWP